MSAAANTHTLSHTQTRWQTLFVCTYTCTKPSNKAKSQLLPPQPDLVIFQIQQPGAHLVLRPDRRKASSTSCQWCPQSYLHLNEKIKVWYLDPGKTCSTIHKCLELTFLIFWREWQSVSELLSQFYRQMNKLGGRGGKKGISGSVIRLNLRDYSAQRLQFSAWTTFLFPYLWLVHLSKSFLCCFWQHDRAPYTSQTLRVQRHFTASLTLPTLGNHNPQLPV